MSKKQFNFFPFQWQSEDLYIDDEQKCMQTVIRIYGWNELNESVYIRVEDFPIPIWVELPSNIEWTDNRVELITRKLSKMNREEMYNPKSIILQYKQPLYFSTLNKNEETGKYSNKTYPYLQITFRNLKAVEYFTYKLKYDLPIPGLGNINLKCHCYEKSITPVLKLLAFKQLPSSNWIKAKGFPIHEDNKETTKMHEMICSFKDLVANPNPDSMPIVYPRVLSFDNEAYSSNPGSMPKAPLSEDKVFMIGCTICSIKNKKKVYEKYILTLGDPGEIEGATVLKFKSELRLYIGFSKFIQDNDPDVIIGYNIFGWDIKFMVERAEKILMCVSDFKKMGCIRTKECPIMVENWESSAYGKQDMTYLELDGRIFIDMMPYVMRNYKLSNYRLETVCEEFLKDTNKDPLKAQDMFKMYMSGKSEELAIIAKYCIQDSYVTILLYDKLLTWFDLTETATTNGVPIFYIYTKGQQIKMYSQLLKYCVKNNIVVQSNAYKSLDNEQYVGATVTDPKAGLYKLILPFDFASLYPSIILAYNIDYSKLVQDESIPDELCNVIEFEEHLNCKCPKDPKRESTRAPAKCKDGKVKLICQAYKYRFLKADVTGKGVIPTLLENLLTARKTTRKIIAKNEIEIEKLRKEDKNEEADELESLNLVLDKRQLSYKVSANSMYGAMGVKQGRLPFLPGAMCVTYIGRISIKKASDFLETDCGGQVIYNDTDSAYTYFPELKNKTMEEIWIFAEDVVKKVAKLFPAPMKLEFEDKVYYKFLILTKKRYMAQTITRDGVLESKLTKRGVVLQRRDNCPLLRDIYQTVVWYILDNIETLTNLSRESSYSEIVKNPAVSNLLTLITDGLTEALFNYKHHHKNFIITKALKMDTYKTKLPPAHVYVSQKMKERGICVPQNTRIEYVLLSNSLEYNKKELQLYKAEDVGFYVDNKEKLRLDYLYYLEKQFIKPLNEILRVITFQPKLIKDHLEHRIYKKMVTSQLFRINQSNISFIDDITIDWSTTTLYDYVYKYDGIPLMYKDFFYNQSVKDEIYLISDSLNQEKLEIYPKLTDVFKSLQDISNYGLNVKVAVLLDEPNDKTTTDGMYLLDSLMQCIEHCGFDTDKNKNLSLWASQGVLMYSSALTMLKNKKNSHMLLWNNFTQLFLSYIKCPIGLLLGYSTIKHDTYFKHTISNIDIDDNKNNYFQKINKMLYNLNYKSVNWSTVEKHFELPVEVKK